MTWKEFKEAVEAQGVKDDTEISWIDFGGSKENVFVEKDPSRRGKNGKPAVTISER